MKVLNIQTWIDELGEGCLNLDKLQEYLDFMIQAVKRYDSNRYSEWHHVMPKCVDKEKKYRDQGVQINGSDHLKAHLLLVDCFKCNSFRRNLGYAVRQMARDPSGKRKLTPEEHEKARKKFSDGVRGTQMSEEARRRVSEILSDGRLKGENHPFYGSHRSQETKERISLANKSAWTEDKKKEFSERRKGQGNPCYGKSLTRSSTSEETREKMSLSGKDKIWINNGVISTKISQDQQVPEGWMRGRLSFKRSSNGQLGKIWIVNSEGICRKIARDSLIPEGFQRGRSFI